MNDIAEFIDNEWYVVRHSGELPEVALHASLHFLTESCEGPGLSLAEHHLQVLRMAALERYRDIILRDLKPENRDTSMYRGIKRSIVNFYRYQRFCHRQRLEAPAGFLKEVAMAFSSFLTIEAAEVRSGARVSVINCSYRELYSFAVDLGLAPEMLPDGLARICPGADT